jgi:ribosomal protein L37AE/L43A
MTEYEYGLCPYCSKKSVELIIINDTGMARCTDCLKKMRLPDYTNAQEMMRIMRGGRI